MSSSPSHDAAVRSVPVGIISGHYGAGKTLLLSQLLPVHRGGPLAVLLFHHTGQAPDANAIRGASRAAGRTRDEVWTLPVTPGDALPNAVIAALQEAAQARRFERIWCEIDPSIEPAQVNAWLAAAALPDAAFRLVSWWHVIESVQFWHEQVRVAPERLRAPERFFAERQLLHLRAASAVFLREAEAITAEVQAHCVAFIQVAAPHARLISTATGEWQRQQFINALSAAIPAPEAEQAAPESVPAAAAPAEAFSLVAHRPFHPGRFWDFLAKDRLEIWRMKGFFWLASRPEMVGGLSHAGPHYSCGLAGSWWVNVPREEWPQEAGERARIEASWREPFGDRRQELVVTGAPGCERSVRPALEACLLSLAEVQAGPEEWALWLDPFPGWELGETDETVATPLNGG